jgi:rSAM/selenodomain-associated transferase 1
VKTRLFPLLSPQAAADLHTAFVYDMIGRFRNFPDAFFELHTDIRTDAWADTGVSRKLQTSGHLGLKMVHALDAGLRAGHQRALIIGSDAPTLPAGFLESLLSSAADVSLGPADDGGFYAISAQRVSPSMFDGVEWSRPHTMRQTLHAIERSGLSTGIGPEWFDVDEPEDLQRLLSQPDLPPHTAAALHRLTVAQTNIP